MMNDVETQQSGVPNDIRGPPVTMLTMLAQFGMAINTSGANAGGIANRVAFTCECEPNGQGKQPPRMRVRLSAELDPEAKTGNPP